jgi:hypothetical protein
MAVKLTHYDRQIIYVIYIKIFYGVTDIARIDEVFLLPNKFLIHRSGLFNKINKPCDCTALIKKLYC